MSKPWLRTIIRVLVLAVILYLVNRYVHAFFDMLQIDLSQADPDMVRGLILTAALLYAVALALPFVPGIEIGLALMAVIGPEMGYLVYGCTVAGLCLGFALGRLVPLHVLARTARDLGLDRSAALLDRFAALPRDQVFSTLLDATPNRLAKVLLRNRYLALALLINLPGNSVIGGGGGIAMMAGLSRVFSPLPFALIVAVAVAPVPLAIAYFGSGIPGYA